MNHNDMVLHTLHLFAGGGGGLYADLLLGHIPIGAVEIDKNPRRMLLERQLAGELPRFPVWDDIHTFRLDNPATEPYIRWCQSIRDRLIIAGGFPCQDISGANPNAQGLSGGKSGLWFEMLRVIGEIRPSFVFVENVALLVNRGLSRVLGGLAELGYDASWGIVSATDAAFLGIDTTASTPLVQGWYDPPPAPLVSLEKDQTAIPQGYHERKRLWIVARDPSLADSDRHERKV